MTPPENQRPGSVTDYEYIVNHGRAVIFVWRRVAGWPVDFVSDNVRAFGYTPEDFTSGAVPYASIIHPGDMPRVLAEVEQFMGEMRSEWNQEYRIATKSGEYRWVEDRTFALRDPKGRVTHIQGLILDITDRHAAEDALRASERKFRGIVEQSGDGIVVTDEQGRIIDWNIAQERMTGLLRSEALGRKLWDVQARLRADAPSGEPSGFQKAIQTLLATGEGPWVNLPVERSYRRPDGTSLVMESIVFTIPTAAGFQVASINRDVTVKKQAEKAVKHSLREKEILLREVNHRVKNNMQVLSSLLNFQAAFVKDPAALRMLEESRDRIRSMALIHERLYKADDLAHIDFAEYLRNLVAILVDSYAVGAGRVRAELDVQDTFLSLSTGIPCGLIVNELVTNSLKHAFPGDRKGRIRIELKPMAPSGYRLVVSDDGVGFPADVDFRTTNSLGLQVIGMLVEQINGTIELKRNGGAAFIIEFKDAVPAKPPAPAAPAE